MWKDTNGCISENSVSPTPIIIADVPLNKGPDCEPAEKKGSSILEHFLPPLGGATLPLMPSSSPQQHSHPLSLHPLRGKITITKGHSQDYQINIRHGLFVPAPSTWSIPPFPHFSLNLSLTCALWLIRVFTLCPSSSLTASGYARGSWGENRLMNRRTWKEGEGRAVMRDSPPFRSDSVDSLWPAAHTRNISH